MDLVNQSFLVLVKYIMGVSCMFERFFFLLRFLNFSHMCQSFGIVGHMFERFFFGCLSFDACTLG